MIREVKIKNFRCFSSLNLSAMPRVNVIVGPSASGKTAFLESLFISSSPNAPTVAFQIRAFRRLGTQIEISPEASSYVALWRDLFHMFNEEQPISIEIIGSENDSRSLLVYVGESEEQILPLGKQNLSPAVMPQMVFEWKRGNQTPIIVKPRLSDKGLSIQIGTAEHFPMAFFGPNAADAPQETARRFSELSKTGDAEPIIDALRKEFPFLVGLSIEFAASNPGIFASIQGQKIKLPVGLVSEGINKLLSILIGIRTYKRGAVLLDQIEDGFYFERFPSIWRIIHQFAEDNEVQIFAATHSLECLRAMLPTVKKNEQDFMLLRAERANGHSQFTQIEGKLFEAALAQGFDVR
jgi:hypothetical protein